MQLALLANVPVGEGLHVCVDGSHAYFAGGFRMKVRFAHGSVGQFASNSGACGVCVQLQTSNMPSVVAKETKTG